MGRRRNRHAVSASTTDAETNAPKRKPFWLRGNFAPVPDEITATDLEVVGAIPPELNGRYFRNGANPVTGESGHWFMGDGMLHGVELRDGKANWYRNRWVQTPSVDEPDRKRERGLGDLTDSKANTHVVAHAGRILCLEEGHVPWEVTPDLETVGPCDFDGQLTSSFTAHPKICPETGEMFAFGYGVFPPFLTYLRVDAAGQLVQKTEIDVPAATMMHDFNVTRNHVVFMDLPIVFDLDRAMSGSMPFQWDDGHRARLGVMSRSGDETVRWFDIDPCYVFHPMNAYESGDTIVLDVARYPSLWKNDASFEEIPFLWRWTIDLTTGTVHEQQLDDRGAEFARIPDALVGLDYRYGYVVGLDEGGPDSGKIIKYDLVGGGSTVHDSGRGRLPGEVCFVPAADGTAEDDGWLIGYRYDKAEDRSDVVILDASDMGADPVATIALPRRVPFGFHGSWIPDDVQK